MAQKKVFLSAKPDQRVIVRPRRPERLDVDGRVISKEVTGIYAQFNANRLETDDSDVIEGLKKADEFETPGGWWLEDAPPDEPKPTQKQQLSAITKATAKGDTDALRELIDEERAGHNRVALIDQAELALANIEVPDAEQHGKLGRADEPAEDGDDVPKVDPPELTSRIEPEHAREAIIKSEDVAESRGKTVPEGEEAIEKKIEAEEQAAHKAAPDRDDDEETVEAEAETVAKRTAAAGPAKKKAKRGGSKSTRK
jgi:hypothetical protein